MTASTTYTLDHFRAAPDMRELHGTTTSESHDSFTPNNAGAVTGPSLSTLAPVKEVNRMLKLFIAGQTFAMDKWDTLRNSEEGQTMAEYGVVLTVIAIGVIVALTALSGGIGRALDAVTGKFPAA